MRETESEFGQGCIYNLGLFVAHQYNAIILEEQYEQINNTLGIGMQMNWCEMWFNGAADHMFDLIIPTNYPLELQERMNILQSKCLTWRQIMSGHNPIKDDVWWAIGEAKELLRLIDEFHGIKTIKGQYE